MVDAVFGDPIRARSSDCVSLQDFAVAVTTAWAQLVLGFEYPVGDLEILQYDPNSSAPWDISTATRQRALSHAAHVYQATENSAEVVTLAALTALSLDNDVQDAITVFREAVFQVQGHFNAPSTQSMDLDTQDPSAVTQRLYAISLGGPKLRWRILAGNTDRIAKSSDRAAVYLFEEFGYKALWESEHSGAFEKALCSVLPYCRDDSPKSPAPDFPEEPFTDAEDVFFRSIITNRLCKLWTSHAWQLGRVPACRYQALLPFACYVARRASTHETRERANRLAQIALAARREKLWLKQLRDLVAELPNRPRFTWRLFGAGIPFALALGALIAIPVSALPDNLSTYVGSTGLVLVAAFVRWARRAAHYASTSYPIIPSLVAGLLLGAAYEGAQAMTQRLYYGSMSADQLTAFAIVVLPVAVVALTLAANRGLEFRVPESTLLPDGIPDDLTGEINEWFERLREPGYHPSWDTATRVGEPIYNQYANLSALGRPAEALATARDEVHLLRQLAQENPDAYTALLASTLNRCGWLIYLNMRSEDPLHPDREAQAPIEEARIITEEALWIRRSLAARYPEAYEAGLATSLHNLGAYLTMAGHVDEAVTALSEAVAIWRRQAQPDTVSILRDLADSLQLLGQVLFDFADQAELALAPLQEAVSIRQRLAERFPTAFRGSLAASQLVLNRVLEELSQSQRRVRPWLEAEKLLRQPSQDRVIGHEVSLAGDAPTRRRERRLGPLIWAAVVIVVVGSVTAWFLSRPVWIPGVGTAYVTSDEGIVPINLVTGQAGSPITIDGTAYGVALSPQGSTAYVVNETTCRDCQGTVGISSLLPVSLPGGPDGKGTFLLQGSSGLGQAFRVVLSPNGRTAYVMTANGVVPVSTRTGEKGATIGIGDAVSSIAISPSGRTLYVTASNGKAIYSVNLRTAAIGGPVKLASSIFAIAAAPSGGSVYVYDTGGIASVNPATASINWQVRSPNLGGGGALEGSLVVTSNGQAAYASGEGVGVVPINLRTHQVGQILLDQAVGSMALSVDSKILYAGCWNGAIYPIKMPTNQVGRPVSAGNQLQFMAVAP